MPEASEPVKATAAGMPTAEIYELLSVRYPSTFTMTASPSPIPPQSVARP